MVVIWYNRRLLQCKNKFISYLRENKSNYNLNSECVLNSAYCTIKYAWHVVVFVQSVLNFSIKMYKSNDDLNLIYFIHTFMKNFQNRF